MKRFFRNVFAVSFICGALFIFYLYFSLPDMSGFVYGTHPSVSFRARELDGDVEIGSVSDKNIMFASYDEIPQRLVNAVISVEDKRFYAHFGIDLMGIGRAFYVNVREGEIREGASTITQQAVNLLYFDKEPSYVRKLKEAMTAVIFESRYGKEAILEIYLNEVYLGANAYGVKSAALTYFNKSLDELTLSECAMLAGIIQAPSAYSPTGGEQNYAYAVERMQKVLGLMLEQGMISRAEYEEAMASPAVVKPGGKSAFLHGGVCKPGYEAFLVQAYEQSLQVLIGYYAEEEGMSEKEAQKAAREAMEGQNLIIETTLSFSGQDIALDQMQKQLSHMDANTDCAFVMLDSSNGDVLAYYGSSKSYDMAIRPRQPGSTIKPLYFSYLIDKGIRDPLDIVDDNKNFALFEPGIGSYQPRNNLGIYEGYVTMRTALMHSLNIASLRFYASGTQSKIIDYLKELGITTISEADEHAYAVAIGGMSEGISPLQLAQAYAAINNGGTLHEANFITRIIFPDGTLIDLSLSAYKDLAGEPSRRVMSEATSATMKDLLYSVVASGTGTEADPGYVTNGKTGTTDNAEDVWFAGSTGEDTMVIWMGSPDRKPVENLSSTAPQRVYRTAMQAMIKDRAAGMDPRRLTPSYALRTEKVYILKNAHTVTRNKNVTAESVYDGVLVTEKDKALYLSRGLLVEEVVLCEETLQMAGPACPHKTTVFMRPGEADLVPGCSKHTFPQ